MHGGYPQEYELREESECRRDRPWNRLAMPMSHGKLPATNILPKPNRLAKPFKALRLVLLMLYGVPGLQSFFAGPEGQ
jgi:hypothetical protein